MTWEIKHGDWIERLKEMPAESVQCCVTSPPYWGLRDYGTARWEGGSPDCDHAQYLGGNGAASAKQVTSGGTQKYQYRETCQKCGAERKDGQLGLERTPDEYIAKMVEGFREVRRVLRKDGTLWLNLGDSYFGSWGNYGGQNRGNGTQRVIGNGSQAPNPAYDGLEQWRPPTAGKLDGLKPKDLVGIPWMVAFALRADGWYLRQDIIWAKPNPMPESVTDRCTKSHEYLFLLSKSSNYFCDMGAIKEDSVTNDIRRPYGSEGAWQLDGRPDEQKHGGEPRSFKGSQFNAGKTAEHQLGRSSSKPRVKGNGTPRNDGDRWNENDGRGFVAGETRNKRSVWEVATSPFPEAHFATFPPKLVEPCILAGCPPAGGKRCDCQDLIESPTGSGPMEDPTIETGRAGMNRPRRPDEGTRPITRKEQREYAAQLRESAHHTEMECEAGQAFEHYVRTDRSGARPIPSGLLKLWIERGWLTIASRECNCPEEPAGTVLDPFAGAGTTGLVATRLHRNFIGIELNQDYIAMAQKRIESDAPLFNTREVTTGTVIVGGDPEHREPRSRNL